MKYYNLCLSVSLFLCPIITHEPLDWLGNPLEPRGYTYIGFNVSRGESLDFQAKVGFQACMQKATGLVTKNKTSEMIVRNLYRMFPRIPDSLKL